MNYLQKIMTSVGVLTVAAASANFPSTVDDVVRVRQSRAISATAEPGSLEYHPASAKRVKPGDSANVVTTAARAPAQEKAGGTGLFSIVENVLNSVKAKIQSRTAQSPTSIAAEKRPEPKPSRAPTVGAKLEPIQATRSRSAEVMPQLPESNRHPEKISAASGPVVPRGTAEMVAKKRVIVVEPPAGIFARFKTAFQRLLNSEPAPVPTVRVKSAEEILADTSQGGFKTEPGAKSVTDVKTAIAHDAGLEAENRAVDTAEMKRYRALESQLARVTLEANEQSFLRDLAKTPAGAQVANYVRVRIGEDELDDEGLDALQEHYVDEFNHDAGATLQIVKRALGRSTGDADFLRMRSAFFALANELESTDREIGKQAWADLQRLKEIGEPQDVKATVAAYTAYSHSIPITDAVQRKTLAEYVKDLRARDPVAGDVLYKRRSLAGSH